MTTGSDRVKKARLRALFWSFLKIGTFTFGGGYAMISLIQREFSYNRKWITKDEFLELVTLAQSAPGAIALNTSVFVGYRMAGYRGAAVAVAGITLPSFVIILLIAIFLEQFKHLPAVEAVFHGLAPGVVALIIAPLFSLSDGMGWKKIAVAVAVALMVWLLPFSPIYYIVLGAAGGIGYMLYKTKRMGGLGR